MKDEQAKSKEKALEQQILNALEQVEKATSKLFKLENILEQICRDIQALNFDFVSISLISLEHNTIEGIYGTGIAKQWTGMAKHYLEKDPELRDIQADIVLTRQTEVISGWDRRFDRWIYREYGHEQLLRVFTPIVLVEDNNGKIIEDWFEYCQWEKIVPKFQESKEGQNEVFQIRLPKDLQSQGEIVVIGTVETGYSCCKKRIEREQLFELLQYIAKKSLEIWQAQLPRVLETIAERVKQFLNADAATLHFLYEPDQQQGRYIYEVFSGGVGKQFLKACPPRNNGLGRQAIQDKKYKVIPEPSGEPDNLEMERFNPKACNAGIKAMAAFPLLVDGKEGVLYVLFRREHKFIKRKLRFVELFVRRWAVDAISYTTRIQQMRDGARWRSLHSITQSLSRIPEIKIPDVSIPDVSNLLRRIAWNSLNILGADVVNIYEYIQTERKFMTPPKTAGRLKEEQKMREKVIGEQNVPFLLIKHGENIYAPYQEEEPILQNSSFTNQEGIKSVAGILLKVDNQDIVGVMLINYRRLHSFSEEEKIIIETLASSAAIAIQNHRWLTARDKINRLIITTIDQEKLLKLIVRESLKITGADLGGIYLFDSSKQELVTQVECAANNTAIDPSETRISINQGITGWVTEHGQSVLVDNVQNDTRYHPYFPNTRSELCVPLLDKEHRVFGVLNVESQRISAFNQRHQGMLEALATQAVIGITQYLENKKQLVKMKTMAAVGNLAGPLVHRMNNGVGAIRSWAQDIIDEGNEYSQNKANQILSTADQIIQATERMKSWIQEKPQSVNLRYVVDSALGQMYIPPGITPIVNIPTNLPPVLGTEQQLIDIFDNLIQNGIDALNQIGTLSIAGTLVQLDVGIWVEIRVCDTGVGIEAENLEKIFEFGYTTKEAKRGMGFGLWWTKFYVEYFLEGRLNVNSVLGQGSQFTLLLPAYNELKAEP
ncbi:GAF domain-containing protein [Scytonema sp. UIC 10036]|uniref:GAF domain-containing protein n=1 Tax=Scytonema sp. UIC 10036 TaxID=2304196 RepID=UPI0012DA1584|nr:GAF domain-containing protein [Scytonema sp. UIC 10036]MUG91861.1 GAF domain-containing protein [Scytonema sp. UIC 10036]